MVIHAIYSGFSEIYRTPVGGKLYFRNRRRLRVGIFDGGRIMGVDRWIADNNFEPRYQFWTRANVSEVLPAPPSPLGWDMVWEHTCIAGWRDVNIQRLGIQAHELDRERGESIGIFGGYAYLGAASMRVWAGRVPGMTPTAIDDAYFGGSPDVPPYVAEPWHQNERGTQMATEWLGWVTVGLDQSELQADMAESLQVQRARPDFATLSDQALLGYALSLRPLIRRMFHQHINQSGAASVGPGLLGQICAAIGQPLWAMRLMAALGGVDSAAPSYAMWNMSRAIRSSSALTALFDAGTSSVCGLLSSSTDPDIAAFGASFNGFLREYGSRGPNEWDLAAPVWENQPTTALAAIDRMRMVADDKSPLIENAAREQERHGLEAQVRAALAESPEALGGFEVGLASAATFIPGRERSKTSIIRVLHELRMATNEFGNRFTVRGVLEQASDIYLLFVDELTELVAGNSLDVGTLIPARLAHRTWLTSLEPPFILNGQPTPNTEWPVRGARAIVPVAVGDVIIGVPGCPGTATGRARIILDPSDPFALEPGDILVAPATDPAWTPLFVPAAAVVVNIGAALSHAVIVSRELGIPCVPAAVDATLRIPDGAIITVDGDNATVTIIELPA